MADMRDVEAEIREKMAEEGREPIPVPELVKVIKVEVDVGSHEPKYDVTELELWSDGSISWRRSGISGYRVDVEPDGSITRTPFSGDQVPVSRDPALNDVEPGDHFPYRT